MAPEYVLWGQLTEKADVYSFGVVAMEIVSGKSNTKHKGTADHLSLLDWVTFLFCPFDVYKFSLLKHLFVFFLIKLRRCHCIRKGTYWRL